MHWKELPWKHLFAIEIHYITAKKNTTHNNNFKQTSEHVLEPPFNCDIFKINLSACERFQARSFKFVSESVFQSTLF